MAPRLLSIAFILFLSLFSLDVFGEGYGFWNSLLALTKEADVASDYTRLESHPIEPTCYRAYLEAAERLTARGDRLRRVVLDYELKREYQRFLQERNRGRADSDGRPDRDAEEIALWAVEHNLPYFDDQVHFPDVRIEYEDLDGRSRQEDVEVTTVHYRGAHAAAAARSGFSRYGGMSARVSAGRGGSRGGGGGRDPRLAEEMVS